MARLKPYLSKSHDKPRFDDRWVFGGIVIRKSQWAALA